MLARLISKIAFLFERMRREYLADESLTLPASDDLPEVNDAIREMYELRSATTVYCITGRSGLENIAATSLKRLLKQALGVPSPAPPPEVSSTSFLSFGPHSPYFFSYLGDQNAASSSRHPHYGALRREGSAVSFADTTQLLTKDSGAPPAGVDVAGDPNPPSSAPGSSGGRSGFKVRNKTWSALKPMHAISAVALLALGISAMTGAILGAILPLTVTLAVISIFSLLAVGFFLMLMLTRRTVLRNVRKGAAWVLQAEAREKMRKQQAQTRAKELVEQMRSHAGLADSSSGSDTDSDSD